MITSRKFNHTSAVADVAKMKHTSDNVHIVKMSHKPKYIKLRPKINYCILIKTHLSCHEEWNNSSY